MHKLLKPINALIKFIQCHEIRGKYRLFELTKHICNGYLITYKIKGANFSIPWDQWCFWKNYGPENYYLDEILPFTHLLNEQLEQFDFIDLGADVGVVSVLINKHCNGLNNIIALEPNPKVYNVLKENLANISEKHRAFNEAISDFNGSAQFQFNDSQGSDHEGHLINNSLGKTGVTTLDTLIEKNKISIGGMWVF